MKIVWNKVIPVKGFYAITVIKWIFVRDEYQGSQGSESFKRMIRHESIHEQQILDWTPKTFPEWLRYTIGSILFYPTYVVEWLIKFIIAACKKFEIDAYKSISYEQEAYNNEDDLNYLENRKKFSWLKYIFKTCK